MATVTDETMRSVETGWIPADVLKRVAAGSPFLHGLASRDPDRLAAIGAAEPDRILAEARQVLDDAVAAAASEADAMAALRRFRQTLALTVALADLAGRFDLAAVSAAMTAAADAALKAALSYALRTAHKAETLTPDMSRGYALIAMGKHGAGELNYSSDIDVIAVFDPSIAMAPAGREMTPHFVRVTQHVVKLLQTQTADGYVFRVDLRLRPDPGATPVAITFDGALNYYEALGQNWERAALIKARPVAGDPGFGATYLKALRPFVWRRHLDFAAIADIHAMKRQIHASKGHGVIAVEGHNIKLGRGGIREIEFFVQTQQLIAAGRAPELRVRETLKGLDLLTECGWITAATRDDMAAAYVFLRTVENRLQMMRDEQTHVLPATPDAVAAFAQFADYGDRDAFAVALVSHLETVQRHYEALFAGEKALSDVEGSLVFTGVEPDPDTVATLERMGFSQPDRIWQTFAGWHQGRIPAMRSAKARELLTELTPALFVALRDTGTPESAFVALDRFLSQLPAGVQMFSMLAAHPRLLSLLMAILGAAPRLARGMVRRPTLLDAVLDPRFFGQLPDRRTIAEALDSSLDVATGYEDALDTARLVGQDQAFLIGIRQLTGNLSHEAAAAAYTALADLLIERLLGRAWDEVRAAHGEIPGGQVAVLGMGKLGSAEMTAASDLDLILIYDHDGDASGSDGARPLAPTQYFARLTQRLIAALSAPTARGTLYEVDMRLRPSGRSGPVATRVDSFEAYQREQAWVWEHMALTRARPVCGDRSLMERLERSIRDVLLLPRNAQTVLAEVAAMRARIQKEKPARSHWQMKTAPGGLVDIEFIAQGMQVAHASTRPDILCRSTRDTVAALGDTGLADGDDSTRLAEAHDFFAVLTHTTAVCIDGEFDPGTAPAGLLDQLRDAAGLPDFGSLDAHLKESQSGVRTIFERLVGAVPDPGSVRAGAGNP